MKTSLEADKIFRFLDIRFNKLKELFSDFIAFGKEVHFRKGDTIVETCDTPNKIFYIKRGMIGASRLLESGNEIFIFLLGEHCVFPDCFYFANINVESRMIALRDVELIQFDKKVIDMLLNNMIFMRYMLYSASLKAVLLANRLHYEFNANREDKILNLVRELTVFACEKKDGKYILDFTHDEIASILGMHRTTVSKILSKLSKTGVIHTGRKNIEIIL